VSVADGVDVATIIVVVSLGWAGVVEVLMNVGESKTEIFDVSVMGRLDSQ
jgi:hypothetical protein